MKISFLEATTPLVKAFTKSGDDIETHSYPHVLNFTSHSYNIRSIRELYKRMTDHAAKGHCLLKGEIQRELVQESRAGSTDAAVDTQYICFDIDGLPGIDTIEDFIKLLPKEFHTASYVTQYSASMGIIDKGLCAHVFFMLHTSTVPSLLKQWLTRLNLDIPVLRKSLRLSKTANALKWPLDVSVCQNDKLIYIAPPKLTGDIKDPYKNKRIELVTKRSNIVKFNFSKQNFGDLRADTLTALNELRKANGLSTKRKTGEKIYKDIPVSTATSQAQITGIKEDRGFIYLNLNGGDSWGYYHPVDNCDIIYNFKGEPNYLTRELLPEYYAERRSSEKQAKKKPRNTDGAETGFQYFAFIDKKSDNYFRGKYCEETEELELLETAKRTHVADYLKQHGQYVPEFFELWDVEFRPDLDYQIDFDQRTVNSYHPTDYILNADANVDTPPPLIKRVIYHALGNDTEAYNAFINWLAAIAQYHIKTNIAWILHGTQGTGKGLLFNKIITPIFGHQHTHTTSMDTLLNDRFNGFLENSIFCLIDEADINAISERKRLDSKLKQLIAEPTIPIRKMRTAEYSVRNFTNFLVYSNEHEAVHIHSEDRRYSAGSRQEHKLKISNREIETIETELQSFINFLMTMQVDLQAAMQPFEGGAREELKALSRDSNEEVAYAFKHGDLEFFLANRPDIEIPGELQERSRQTLPTYKEALLELKQNITTGNLSRDALQTFFYYITGNNFITPHKFTKFLAHRGIKTARCKVSGRTVHGLSQIPWKLTKELEKELNNITAEKPELKSVGKKK